MARLSRAAPTLGCLIVPVLTWFLVAREFGNRTALFAASLPYALIGADAAGVLLCVALGPRRRAQGRSLPFGRRWHVGDTLASDAAMAHAAFTAALCLLLGGLLARPTVAALGTIALCGTLLLPVRDPKGRYGPLPAFLIAGGLAALLLPVRLIRLYGPHPLPVAAALAALFVGAAALALCLAWKSADAWTREQAKPPAAE